MWKVTRLLDVVEIKQLGDAAARVLLGGTLLLAAALKGAQLLAARFAADAAWWWVALVAGEIVLGLWLLSGWLADWSRFGALMAFGSFAVYSLLAVMQGRPECGCFGEFSVDPRAMLLFDLMASGALLMGISRNSTRLSLTVMRLALPAWCCLLCLSVLGFATNFGGWALAGENGANVVVLEPEQWVGKRFPLLEEIDIGEELARGKWKVLLYHHDCPKCQAALNRLSKYLPEKTTRAAAIEAPPYSATTSASLQAALAGNRQGHLSDSNKWFVSMPCEISLADGTVTAVETGTD